MKIVAIEAFPISVPVPQDRQVTLGIGRQVIGRRADGTTFPMELSVGETRMGGNKFFVGILRDISFNKQAEEALKRSEGELQDRVLELERAKDDLERQHAMLESYCAAKGWRAEVIKDLGSGMNYRKPGLNKLLEMILRKQMRRLVITHKDRLLRFGSELVFALCAHQQIEIVIIHKGEQPTFEEELAKDVLEIITVFSARPYGSRSKKNRDLIEAMKKAAES